MNHRLRLLTVVLAVLLLAASCGADATPFSFEDEKKQPVGFSIDLCKAVVKSIERQNKVQGLAIKWVPVTIQTRFDAVAKGQADMECSSSTVTLSRLKQVDFSSFIFVESTGVVVRTVSGASLVDACITASVQCCMSDDGSSRARLSSGGQFGSNIRLAIF